MVASFPPVLVVNPYQRLLYDNLAAQGIELAEPGPFTVRWMRSARGRVRHLHFHWQESHYRTTRWPSVRALWWLKLGVFGARLTAARVMGFRITWTMHQIAPHESSGRRLDRAASMLLARTAHVLIAHDAPTAADARARLRLGRRPIAVVPHGSYLGVYPPGRPRLDVRRELGVPDDAFAVLCFGGLRAYKEVSVLLDAFHALRSPGVVLVVAGLVADEREAARVSAAAAGDGRIIPLLERIPDDRVAELFNACDAAVLPRGDGGTSGSLILALTMGRGAIVADTPVYRELIGGDDAGWRFTPGDADSLADALRRAAGDPDAARARGEAARRRAGNLSWPEAGRLTAALMRGEPIPADGRGGA